MKTLLTVVVLALLAWGAWALFGGDDEVAAPALNNQNQTYVTPQVATTTGTATATSTGQSSTSTAVVKSFAVSGSNFAFAPSTMRVNRGDRVRVTFTNASGTHDWVLDQFNARTKVLQSGQSETVEFVANQSGSFEYYCSVGSHRAMGMKGTLIVN